MGQIIGVGDRFMAWQSRQGLDADDDLGPASMSQMEWYEVKLAETQKDLGKCQTELAKARKDLARCKSTKQADKEPSFWLPAGIGFIIGALIALAF